jgi:TonB-dependent receptor
MRLKSLACCSASLAALALHAAPAWAQTQAPDPEVQETTAEQEAVDAEAEAAPDEDATTVDAVVVTGIRRSLQSAQGIRRNSDQIVDAVVAEDIGKLPDLNTAQTAARIPGVQVYRQAGEAQNVLVRGLPNFTTTYNGREIFTAETRVVALQDFPSSNIAALEVFKTASANLVEPGMAGLVNVRSRQPFDFKEAQFAGSVWGLYTVQGDEVSPNFNFLATKRWDMANGGEFGALLNVSRTDMRFLDAEISNTDFLQTFRVAGGALIDDPAAVNPVARFPDIQRLFYRSGKRNRPSVNAAVQYRPNSDLEFYGEFLWQGFRIEIDDRLLAAELFRGPQLSSLQFRQGTNLAVSGTTNAPPGSLFSFQGATFNKTDTYQYAGGFRYSPGAMTLNFEVAKTESTFSGSTESVDRRWTKGPVINWNTNAPQFEITNIDFSNPAEQFFDGLYEQNQVSKGEDTQVRLDFEYDLDRPLIRSVQAGARYTGRIADRRFSDRFARTANVVNATALPLKFEVFNGVDFGGTTTWAAPTYDSIRGNLAALRTLVGFSTNPIEPAQLYQAEEFNFAGYGQVNLGSGDVEGTIGVRVVHVDTRVAGPTPTGIPEIDEGGSDTSILPNASVRARVNETVQLRGAVSKTRTLPTFANLNPALVLNAPPPGGIGTPSAPRTGSGGNPFLEPFTSWNFDGAAEFYFGPSTFVSVTVFRRNLDGFIQSNTFRLNDTPLGVLEITGPVNTGEGRINGVELQGQVFADYDWLPEWSRGFGVQGNLTYLDAKTQQRSGPGAAPLTFQPITGDPNRPGGESPGVSEWQYNLVGIYERGGFAARLTYSGQSSYRATQQFRTGGNVGQFNDVYTETARPADRLDLSLNYDIGDRFTVFGDWTNITESNFEQDFSSARNGAPRAEYLRYRRYDETTVSLGLRFRFGN